MFALRIACPERQVEIVSDALEALDARSVSVEDAAAQTAAEQALFGEPGLPPPAPGWARSCVTALFADEAAAREAARLLALQDFFAGCALAAIEPVPDQDWVRLTQAQFEPVAITPDFWIVPTWHQPPAQAQTIIRLDPGLAFGTGTHPTTRMCLRWLAAHPPRGLRVLDYGCGSGILAIGAALHGARQTDAVDIDPAAVQATRDNAQANGVANAVTAGLPDLAHGAYDVVLANILATPLKLLAPLLAGHVAGGGALVLAGVLERQTAELQAAYRPWLALEAADVQEGWVLLTARRG
jgi:ribosomal protein L11 methyltransferase